MEATQMQWLEQVEKSRKRLEKGHKKGTLRVESQSFMIKSKWQALVDICSEHQIQDLSLFDCKISGQRMAELI